MKPPSQSLSEPKQAPEKAIVLAAGLAERMRPLTSNTPKAMMPFAGKPVIHHTLSNLQAWGTHDVLINLHHAPSPLVNYLQTAQFPGLKISLSFEPDICGTGGALRRAAWFIDAQPFWMVNSDVIFEIDPALMIKEFNNAHPLACLWLVKSSGPRTVEALNGRITSFSSHHPGSENTATFSGIHLISPSIMNFIPDRPCSSIIEAYKTALQKKIPVLAVEDPQSYWADIGSPEKLLATHIQLCNSSHKHLTLHRTALRNLNASRRILNNKGASIRGFVSASQCLSISGAPVIENAVLGNNITLGPSARIANCVAGSGTRINTSVKIAAISLSEALDPIDIKAMKAGGFAVENVLAESLPPRGSDRSFYRLHAGKSTYILTKYKTVRTENALFTTHLRFLGRIGFPVPRLYLDLPANNLCVVEDLGNRSVQNTFTRMQAAELNSIYYRTVECMALLHTKGTGLARKQNHRLEPPFNYALYKWEHRLFAEHYLQGTIHLDPQLINKIMKELELLSEKLHQSTQVLIHRDLQSSNILLKKKRPVIIDFQGMRFGCGFYDAASLVFDPYVSLPDELKSTLIKQYADARRMNPSTAWRMTQLAGIQRLSQAIGAYGRLSKIEGMSAFSAHIRPAAANMKICLQSADFLPELSAVINDQP